MDQETARQDIGYDGPKHYTLSKKSELVHIKCTFGQHNGMTYFYDPELAADLVKRRRAEYI